MFSAQTSSSFIQPAGLRCLPSFLHFNPFSLFILFNMVFSTATVKDAFLLLLIGTHILIFLCTFFEIPAFAAEQKTQIGIPSLFSGMLERSAVRGQKQYFHYFTHKYVKLKSLNLL